MSPEPRRTRDVRIRLTEVEYRRLATLTPRGIGVGVYARSLLLPLLDAAADDGGGV